MKKEEIDKYIKEHSQSKEKNLSFVEYLYKMMNKYKVDSVSSLYNKANISRQLWSSIVSEKSNPSLNVCIKIVFALKMNNSECKLLLKKAGYTLASSSKYSLIIRYAIENNNYSLNELNEMLSIYGFTDSLII